MLNARKTYDYYLDKLGRRSFDGNGAIINLSYDYHDSGTYTNAFWNSDLQQFAIGNGGGLYKGLDVIGHEYTHAVISYVVRSEDGGGLIYADESGALNESIADIMGSLVEGKTADGKWLIGEDSDEGAIRSMSDPSDFEDPENYSERYRGDDQSVLVHTNSSIFNFAAYKMMNDSRTSGISDDTWAEVFYKSLYRMPSDATFLQARRCVISAASALGFTSEQQQAMRDAFDAVGITEPETVRIVLTWGETPEDIDSHLTGPTVDGDNTFHTYYSDKNYRDYVNDNETLIANLDYDDTTSYGPEVTTIYDYKEHPGTYSFFVRDYTNRDSSSSTELAHSGALVRIYYGTGREPAAQYSISSSSDGTIWNVCTITIGESGSVSITPVNTYEYKTGVDW